MDTAFWLENSPGFYSSLSDLKNNGDDANIASLLALHCLSFCFPFFKEQSKPLPRLALLPVTAGPGAPTSAPLPSGDCFG